MSTLTITLDDQQTTEHQKQVDADNASKTEQGNPTSTPDEFATREYIYARGLTPSAIEDKEAAILAEEYKKLDQKGKDAVKATLAAEVADVADNAEPITP